MKKSRSDICFIFGGIGVDYKSRIKNLDEKFVKDLDKIGGFLKVKYGIDILSYLYNKEVKKNNQDITEWVAIYTCDYLLFDYLIRKGIKPDKVFGYSMGLVTATASVGSISYEDGVKFLINIKDFTENEYSMSSIIGLTYEEIKKIIVKNSCEEYVQIGCLNSECSYVISGIKDKVELINVECEKMGVLKIININTSYAFHTRYMFESSMNLKKIINKFNLCESKYIITSCINGKELKKSNDISEELFKILHSVVNWGYTIKKQYENTDSDFIEVSLYKSISKLTKINAPGANFYTYESIDKLKSKNSLYLEGV